MIQCCDLQLPSAIWYNKVKLRMAYLHPTPILQTCLCSSGTTPDLALVSLYSHNAQVAIAPFGTILLYCGITIRTVRLLRILTDLYELRINVDTYGRWNSVSQRGSWQLRTARLRPPTDGRHQDDNSTTDDNAQWQWPLWHVTRTLQTKHDGYTRHEFDDEYLRLVFTINYDYTIIRDR